MVEGLVIGDSPRPADETDWRIRLASRQGSAGSPLLAGEVSFGVIQGADHGRFEPGSPTRVRFQ